MSLPSSVVLKAMQSENITSRAYEAINVDGGAEFLTEDKGLVKKIMKQGEGDTPPKGSKVSIAYQSTLHDSNTVVDSSKDIVGKYDFVLGLGNVIKAWDIGISSMKKGERSLFVCRDDYCFSEGGSPPNIPPKSILRYEIELIDWEAPLQSVSQRVDAANAKKEEGNVHYKDGSFEKAEKIYQKALEYVSEDNWNVTQQEESQMNVVKVMLYLNLAACQLKTKNFGASIENCTKALVLEPKNVKALFRRGQTFFVNGDFEKAKEDLEAAAKLAPNSMDIKKELEQLRRTIQDNRSKEKKMFGNLFDKLKKVQNQP